MDIIFTIKVVNAKLSLQLPFENHVCSFKNFHDFFQVFRNSKMKIFMCNEFKIIRIQWILLSTFIQLASQV